MEQIALFSSYTMFKSFIKKFIKFLTANYINIVINVAIDIPAIIQP